MGSDDLVGEICCVTKSIGRAGRGSVSIKGSAYSACSLSRIPRGRWVRVLGSEGGILRVIELNVWLGSCCC